MCGYVHVCADTLRGLKMESASLVPELWMLVSCLTWVPRAELGSSARSFCALNHRAISPAHRYLHNHAYWFTVSKVGKQHRWPISETQIKKMYCINTTELFHPEDLTSCVENDVASFVEKMDATEGHHIKQIKWQSQIYKCNVCFNRFVAPRFL